MPRETSIQERIRTWINRQPGCLARKLHGTVYAVKGDPDIYGCVNGRMFVIEVKQPGKQPTPLQRRRLREWGDVGAVAGVAHTLEEAQHLIEPLLETE